MAIFTILKSSKRSEYKQAKSVFHKLSKGPEVSWKCWHNSGWGKKSNFHSSIIKNIMLSSYKELSNEIILFEFHKAMEGDVVIPISRFRLAESLGSWSWSVLEGTRAAPGQVFD